MWLLLVPQINGLIMCLSFMYVCDWLLLLIIMSSSFIYVAVYVRLSLFGGADLYFIVRIHGFCFSINPSVDTWVTSTFWQLGIICECTITLIIWYMGLLDHLAILFKIFEELPYCAPQWLVRFTFPPTVHECCRFSASSPTLIVFWCFVFVSIL